MPHTTTKNLRTNRPDARPNEKKRRQLRKDTEEKRTIQDMRVTKKQKSEKVEREAQVTPLRTLTTDDKYVRSLKKKLTSIEQLLTRKKNGEELDEQQLRKIDQLDDLLEKMDQAAKLVPAANNEEIDN